MLRFSCVKKVKFEFCLKTEYEAAGKYTPFSMRQLADRLSPGIEPGRSRHIVRNDAVSGT